MRHKLQKLSLAALGILTAAFAFLILTAKKSAPIPPLPNPNGYDDFVKAASFISGDTGGAFQMEQVALKGLISTNAEALRLARVGLSRTCSVPTQLALTNFDSAMSDLPGVKRLAHLLNAEGRLAEMENRPADAARSYLDSIRLGNETSRGGFLIHRLVGIACEANGYNPLVKLAPRLTCEQARTLVTELEKTDSTAVTWDEVRQTENIFARHELRKTINPIRWMTSWWQLRPAIKKAQDKHNQILARLRLLTTELALRCYQAELGRAPDRLDQLVPKYLQRVPTDPFSSRPLIYRAQGMSWLFYSVGPDGVDDNGKAVGRSVAGRPNPGDLFFDSPW